jgi:cobalt/nickel transport system permease protein
MPPTARLIAVLVLAVGAAALPLGAWRQLGVLFALVALLATVARLPAKLMLVRMTGPLGFVFLASVGLLVLVPGDPLVRVGFLQVSDAGLLRFGSVLGRAIVALGAAVVLVTTTSFPELLHALREIRLPKVVTTALGLAYRLLYILVDEVERLQRAARSRNAGAGSARRRRVLVGVAAAGLARTFARGERTHRAMLARGYRGDLPTLSEQRWDRRSVVALVTLVTLVGVTTVSAYVGR